MTAYLKIDHRRQDFTADRSETEVLKDITLGSIGANMSRSSAIPAAASPRCSTSWPACCRDHAAACSWRTARSTSRARPRRRVPEPSLLPWLTVYDNVRLAVDKVFVRQKSRAERHAWTMHNLELVQMAHAKDKRPAEISGGMKQRVGLARALAMEPKVLLLDEPFGALDALTRAHLQDSVMAIHQKLGNTVLMITHDVDEAVLLSDRIVMMTNGPAARIGEVLDVPLARPRKRLEVASNPTYLKCRQRVLEFLYERHRFIEAA
jgi:nitrate/nitrite transport system ATP-binding protein